jgi:S-adenosyl methyltransferase
VSNETVPDDDWAWVDDQPDWVPPAVDTATPSAARIYDYLIGGKDHFAVDREAAARLTLAVPGVADGARANRAFMLRCVQEMAEAGIDQFLDLGTGIPTSPNLHETARAVNPAAAAVYVDNDPIVMAHNRALLATDSRIVTVPHDLRDPAAVLEDPRVRDLLDFSRPIGLLMIAVMHFVDLNAAPLITSRYFRELAPGSRVALTAGTRDGVTPQAIAASERVYAGSGTPFVFRTRAQVEQLFDGLRLLPPGIEDVYRSDHGRVMGGRAVK